MMVGPASLTSSSETIDATAPPTPVELNPLGPLPKDSTLPQFIFQIGQGGPPNEDDLQRLEEVEPLLVSDEQLETSSTCCQNLYERFVRVWHGPEPVRVTPEEEFAKHPEVRIALQLGDIVRAKRSDYKGYRGGWTVWMIRGANGICFVNDPDYDDQCKAMPTAGGGIVPEGKMPVRGVAFALIADVTLAHSGLLGTSEDDRCFQKGIEYRYGCKING